MRRGRSTIRGASWCRPTREDVLRRYENHHLAPLEVFYRTSDDKKKPSFFFVLENRRYGELTCEVGVFKTDALNTGFSAYASDLLKARLAKVPLGDGKAVLMKYREGLNARYVILSIGEMAGDAGEPADLLANYSV
jgi:nucleoid-associated protein YejK